MAISGLNCRGHCVQLNGLSCMWPLSLQHCPEIVGTQLDNCLDAKEESAELGAVLHSDEGAASVVQEDGGVLP